MYLEKVLSREYASGRVNERIAKVIESGGQGIKELLRRYVVGVEEGMAQRFWQCFGERYKEEVRHRVKGEGHVMEVIIEMFAKFKDHSLREQSPLAAGFLQYTVQMNQQILRGYNHSLEIALYIDKLRKLEET